MKNYKIKFISRARHLAYTGAILYFALGVHSSSQAQTEIKSQLISGKVIDRKTKTGIPGVNIVVDRTYRGCTTDGNGNFSIQAGLGQTLVFSSIGYVTQKVKIVKPSMVIELEEHVESLDEVTVRATKNINDIDMRKIAGAIETVNVQKLSSRPEINLSMMLQGQVPGLVVTSTGELGTKPTVRIRGTSSFRKGDAANEPLYVLDGMIISSDAFYTLNAEDFEEIKVLKDAAASALYGIKAANGVVEITSKRGYNGKPRVTYRNNTGITFRGTRGIELMDTQEKLELERLLKAESCPGYLFSEDYFRKYFTGDPFLEQLIANGQQKLDSLKQIKTDWFKELIKTNFYQSHSLSIRGGNSKNSYYYSFKYDKQGGRVEGNSVKRFTGRMNLDYKISSKLVVSFNNSVGYSLTKTPYGSSYDPTTLVYNLNPYEQKTDPATGKHIKLYSYPNRTLQDLMNEYSKNATSKRLNSSLNANWEIFEGLNLSAIAGGDFLLSESLALTPRDAYSQRNYKDSEKGEISKDKNTEFNYSSNIRLNYNKVFEKHDLTLSANYDYYYIKYDNIGLTGYGLASKVHTAAGINQGLTGRRRTRVRNKKEKSAQVGIGLALGYSFNSTYDIYGSYKTDASSILPSDKRWNTAWSIGCGWEMANYPFLKDQNFLTRLRAKASYGYTANMGGISASATVPTYSYSDDTYSESRILDLNTFYNQDLKPEQTKSTNIGLEFQFMKKINLEVNAYKRITEDALLTIQIPVSNGYTEMSRNIGILQNYGFEFRLSGNWAGRDKLRCNSSLSLSWNRNEVVDLYEEKAYYDSNDYYPDMEEGKPLGVIYGLSSLGIHSVDGLPRYLSATGEQIDYTRQLTREDFSVLGYSTPPYTGFFNNAIRYKNFDLTFDFYFSFGGIAKSKQPYVRDLDNVQYNAVKGQTKDMWFKAGDENKLYPTVNVPSAAYTILDQPTDRSVYKTDYVRLNNVSLSYRLPEQVLKNTKGVVKHASFTIQAQNIFTLRAEKPKASLKGIQQPILTLGASITF
jgi:TonB-linked SusC/RagA family outer membrane protein